MTKTTQVSLYLPKNIATQVEDVMQNERRKSINNTCVYLLELALNTYKQGFRTFDSIENLQEVKDV